MTTFEGNLIAPDRDLKIGIVVARFNELVTEPLLQGALGALQRHGGKLEQVDVSRVPGAFELPLIAKTMADTGRYAAIICIGCVIRGDTSHYDYVCAQAASGIQSAALQTGVPVIFGVLTTDTLDQALARAGSKGGNKGAEAMAAAIEMVDLVEKIKTGV